MPLFTGQLKSGQEAGEREGERHAAKGHGWNRTRVCCSEDIASVYGAPALPTESPGAPTRCLFFNGKDALNICSSCGESTVQFRQCSSLCSRLSERNRW